MLFLFHNKQVSLYTINAEWLGVLDLKGKAKWDAQNKLKGTSKEDAVKKYIYEDDDLKRKIQGTGFGY
ncbi:acyl-CoA-binding protein-like [Vulpes lagopus]|uniref:acyl-CoA-binding protein-like n=1 Tax=Vulpes lagopus TaxID=494514 RepID=UPI001BC94C9F|nr:acyl-CoA-binding protein-like [Vulpes lagopus]